MKTISDQNKVNLTFLLSILVIFLTATCEKNPEESNLSPWYSETNSNGDPLLGVFENKLPCEQCEKIKFALAIYKDLATNQPTTYMMARVYVASGNERFINEGNIRVSQGTRIDSSAIVFHLDSGAPEEFQSFWKINDNLLFILDNNLEPRVGNEAYGYVLNRTR